MPEKFIQTLNTLKGMLAEVNMKESILKIRLQKPKSFRDIESIKNASIVLSSEIDNINLSLDLIEQLQTCWPNAAAA